MDNIGLKAIYLNAARIEPNSKWSIALHFHKYFEFIGVFSGKAIVKYNNKVYKIEAPAVLVYEKGFLHEEKSDPKDPWQTLCMGVDFPVKEEEKNPFYNKIKGELFQIKDPGKVKKILDHMLELFKESTDFNFGKDEIINGELHRFLRVIAEANTGKPAENEPDNKSAIVIKLKKYIASNYAKKLTLKDLTNVVYLSPYYLSHVFKNETGYSPIEFVIKMKIDKAKKLLKNKNITISKIAEEIGYDSIHYFSRIFRAVEGITPSEFRRKNSR